jgi:PEP-CTERM motif
LFAADQGERIVRISIANNARSAIVAAALAAAGALTGSAEASVIRPTASLPLLGVPYISPTGAGCFTIAKICVTPGALIQTKTLSSMFVMGNQEIVTDAVYSATLTPLIGNTIIGSVALTGTVAELVKNRTSDTQTGTFTTFVTGLDLTGALMLPPANPLDGHTLLAGLDPLHTSMGMTTITPEGGVGASGGPFKIDSFFDVFIDIAVPSAGLTKSVGPIFLAAVPEPSTWAMLLVGFAGLGFAGWRRAAASAA